MNNEINMRTLCTGVWTSEPMTRERSHDFCQTRLLTRRVVSSISVRVKDGKSLRNGMWNGVRNGIIMRNTIYAGNKLTEERILFARQFYKSSSLNFDVADYYSQPRSRVNDIFEI